MRALKLKQALKLPHAITGAALLGAVVSAMPVAAQSFSNSYNFLKAVQDSDANKATQALNATNGAIINATNQDTGDTALHIATKRSDAPWMRFLLGYGASTRMRDASGETPMTLAAARGYSDGVRVLLAYKADINAPNENGETPLIKAVQNRQEQVVRMLIDAGANTDATDASGYTALEHAERDRRAVRIADMIKNAAAKKNK